MCYPISRLLASRCSRDLPSTICALRCELKSPDASLFVIPDDYVKGGFQDFRERNNMN